MEKIYLLVKWVNGQDQVVSATTSPQKGAWWLACDLDAWCIQRDYWDDSEGGYYGDVPRFEVVKEYQAKLALLKYFGGRTTRLPTIFVEREDEDTYRFCGPRGCGFARDDQRDSMHICPVKDYLKPK